MSDTLTSLNKRLLAAWQMGIFHAGVEINGVEYSYGYCDRGSGVFTYAPRDAHAAKHRTRIAMGRALIDGRAIERRLGRLVICWSGASYALLTRNCCHFADAFCVAIGVGSIPTWVNGLAKTVLGFTDFPAIRALVARAEREHPAFRARHGAGENLDVVVDDAEYDSDRSSTVSIAVELDSLADLDHSSDEDSAGFGDSEEEEDDEDDDEVGFHRRAATVTFDLDRRPAPKPAGPARGWAPRGGAITGRRASAPAMEAYEPPRAPTEEWTPTCGAALFGKWDDDHSALPVERRNSEAALLQKHVALVRERVTAPPTAPASKLSTSGSRRSRLWPAFAWRR